MAKQKPSDIQEWARLGVTARLLEIEAERATILRAFPSLRAGLTPARRRGFPEPAGAAAPKRRQLSAAARKRISDAQKKRWAAQRAKYADSY